MLQYRKVKKYIERQKVIDMMNITRNFAGAMENGVEVFYNDNLGNFDVHVNDEVISFYDEEGKNTITEVQKFINYI